MVGNGVTAEQIAVICRPRMLLAFPDIHGAGQTRETCHAALRMVLATGVWRPAGQAQQPKL